MREWDLPCFDIVNIDTAEQSSLIAEENKQDQHLKNSLAEQTTELANQQQIITNLNKQVDALNNRIDFLKEQNQQLQNQQHDDQQQVQQRIKLLDDLLKQIDDNYQQQIPELEKALLVLVDKIAQAVIKQSVKNDVNHQVIKEALAMIMPNNQSVEIKAHTQDVSFITEIISKFPTKYCIITDDNLLPGGCIIQQDNCIIDASIEQRLQQVISKMA